jgi:AraC-like DNA-binding protein
MTRRSTIGGIAVLDLLKALDAVGARQSILRRALGIDLSSLEDADARVPTDAVVRMLALAANYAHDPWIGLHAGERAEPRGPLFYLILASPRLFEGLRRAERFGDLAIDGLRIGVETEGVRTRVIFDATDDAFPKSRHAMEYLLMTSVSGLRHAFGAGFRLDEVHFRHHRGHDVEEARRAFDCAVEFDRRDDRLVFARELLGTISRFGNRAIAAEIEKFAVALQARTSPSATMTERVEQAIRGRLARDLPTACGAIARSLGVGSRTLQRRLAEERTGFRAEHDRVLCEVAQAALANPALKLEWVARSVGFADVAAFSKAFRRWKGKSPTSYRRSLARGLSASVRTTRTTS